MKSVRSEMFRNDSFRTEPLQTESSRNESPSKRKLSTRIRSKPILPNRTHADRILSKRIPLEANPPDTHALDTNSSQQEPTPRHVSCSWPQCYCSVPPAHGLWDTSFFACKTRRHAHCQEVGFSLSMAEQSVGRKRDRKAWGCDICLPHRPLHMHNSVSHVPFMVSGIRQSRGPHYPT